MANVHGQMAQKTKEEIQKCFIELVQEEGFQNVSVKKIAERAGINRGTFYIHYVDKFDLMEKIQNNLLNELQNKIQIITPQDAFMAVQQKQIYQPFVAVFQFVNKHAPTLKAILGEQGDPSFIKKVKKVIGDKLECRLISLHPSSHNEVFRQYFLAFLTSAILGFFQEWLEDAHKPSVEDLAKIHFQILDFVSHIKEFLIKP